MAVEKDKYTGINVQWPISELILTGQKTIETRTYPLPKKLLNKKLLMIETPGKDGDFKSRIAAVIEFINCFQYSSEADFYLDMDRHCVSPGSKWSWSDSRPKWGWEVIVHKRLKPKIEMKMKKGIVYTNNISI